MKTELRQYTIRDLTSGFVYNESEGKGLFGLDGQLVIQPEYQRHYIYGDGKKDVAVIESLLRGYPLGLIYFNRTADSLEVLDGQQRITSIGRFVTGKFAVTQADGMPHYFSNMPPEQREHILNYEMLVYECEGDEDDIKEWFQTLNIVGMPLNEQELLNAVYSGPFVTAARAEFSNKSNSNVQKWSAFVRGTPLRQDILATALDWVADGHDMEVAEYMSAHRADDDISEMKDHFNSVIDWASSIFTTVRKEMCGLDWDRLYRAYKDTPYNPKAINARVEELMGDPAIKNKKGIFEFVLGGEQDAKHLGVRLFDDATKKAAYHRQTEHAATTGLSNCPLCAVSSNPNSERIYSLSEMDADHVHAWSKGGATSIENCEMLCKTHNRAKGNK